MVAWSISGRESLLGVFGRWLRRRRVAVGAFLVVAIRHLLLLAGFAAPVAGIWMLWGTPAGLIAAGPAALLVEFFIKRR